MRIRYSAFASVLWIDGTHLWITNKNNASLTEICAH